MTNKSQLALLELLKSSLFGIAPELPDDTDFDAVFQEAAAHTVVALAAQAVPKEFSAQWQEPAAQSIAHYMRALYEQTNLIKLFEKNGIPLVILKGTAAAVYYPVPQLRTMGDIDFLVFEEDFEKTYNLLQNSGYIFTNDYDDGRDYAFLKGDILLELHKRYSDRDFDIEDILINGMKNAVSKSVNGNSFPALPDYENGLLLLDHIRHHLSNGLGLRQIIDWAMFANGKLNNETYEKSFQPLLESAGLECFCKIVTKMCKTYLYLPDSITWCDDADKEAVEQLFETVMLNGNFGRKDPPFVYKPVSAITVNMRKNGFFKTLQTAGVKNFEICRKNRFFRAFAWLFQLFRYLWLGLSSLFKGEKPINDISAGNDKADFYKRLGL